MRTARTHSLARGSTAASLLLLLAAAGCADLNWPFHHPASSTAGTPAADGSSRSDDECADIQAQIRDSEEARREAPATSTNSDIVSAAQGKADRRIEDLQQRYDSLDCPGDSSPAPARVPPLQPAPGAVNR